METLGLVALCAGVAELLYCLYRIAAQLFAGPAIALYYRLLGSLAPRAHVEAMLRPAQAFMQRIAIFEALRTLPFLACTCVLVWLALRTRRRDPAALGALRAWCFFAFGAIAVSALLQAVFIVPATIDYAARIARALPRPPAGRASPIDVGQMTSAVTVASSILGVIFGVVVFSIFPVVVLVWVRKIHRRLAAGESL